METTRPAHERVAGEVRAELARRRISGRKLARELGWTTNYAHRRFSGETPMDVNDLVALADFLDVPIEAFFHSERSMTTVRLSHSGHETRAVTCKILPFALAETVPVATRAA